MNRVSHTSKETVKNTVEPHAARRAVRQTAADNTQKAILFQFPGLFGSMMGGTTTQQYVQNARGDQHATQAA